MKAFSIVFLLLILAVFTFSFVIPYDTYQDSIHTSQVTANYIFAGDIGYNGERIGASSELCVDLMFNKSERVIPVTVSKYLFFTTRVIIKEVDNKSAMISIG